MIDLIGVYENDSKTIIKLAEYYETDVPAIVQALLTAAEREMLDLADYL